MLGTGLVCAPPLPETRRTKTLVVHGPDASSPSGTAFIHGCAAFGRWPVQLAFLFFLIGAAGAAGPERRQASASVRLLFLLAC